MVPVLQTRWKLENNKLRYYGLRAYPHTFHSTITVSKKTAQQIGRMDGDTPLTQLHVTRGIRALIKQKIVVDADDRVETPSSWEDAHFCTQCAANDFMIPGLELNKNGVCPICTQRERYRYVKNVLPLMCQLPSAKDSRYDVAVFYTGGKDSSYLLYYISRVLKLRVLALTWKMPTMSSNALQSIENAKTALPEVTFIMEEVPEGSLTKIYKTVYALQENICICPSLAYVLFYPLLVKEKVPYLLLGNEPAQCKNLLYNHLAPAAAFRPSVQKGLRLLVNTGRILTAKKPLKKGQFEMLMTVKNLAFGKHRLLRWLKYQNEPVDNTYQALAAAPEVLTEFKRAIHQSDRHGRIPALVHMDLAEFSEDRIYNWEKVKRQIEQQIGWVDVHTQNKGLHTSCQIERCKEHSQFIRFRNCQSRIIPFSAIELPIAVTEGCLDREQAIAELKEHSGFCLTPPQETQKMQEVFTKETAVL